MAQFGLLWFVQDDLSGRSWTQLCHPPKDMPMSTSWLNEDDILHAQILSSSLFCFPGKHLTHCCLVPKECKFTALTDGSTWGLTCRAQEEGKRLLNWVHGAKKVNSILGCISRSTAHWPRDAIIPLYSALVTVHLDTASSFGSPDTRKNFFSMMRTAKQDNRLPGEVARSPLWGKLSAFQDWSGKNSEQPDLIS